MATPVSLVGSTFNPLGTPNPFARRADPLLSLLGTLAGSAVGQTLLPAVAEQQFLLQSGINLGPATEPQVPAALTRLRELSATLASSGEELASVSQTLVEAERPAENDLLTARLGTATLVRVHNELVAQVHDSPLVLKEELADSLEATVTALETDLDDLGITINDDGTLSLNESTLASELALSSTTIGTAATTLREVGSRLSSVAAQLETAPAEALLFQVTPDPRSASHLAQPERTPTLSVSGAGLVYAYLVARQQVQFLTEFGSVGSSGSLFSAQV